MGLKSCEVNGKTRKFICRRQQASQSPTQAQGRNSTEFNVKAKYIH